jgi:hypothetical protein
VDERETDAEEEEEEEPGSSVLSSPLSSHPSLSACLPDWK